MCRRCNSHKYRRNRKKSRNQVKNTKTKNLHVTCNSKLNGQVDLQNATVKPILETSIFIGQTIGLDPINKQPIPGAKKLPFVVNVHGDYTFDVEDGIVLLSISDDVYPVDFGHLKGTYKPLNKNLETTAQGIRLVSIKFSDGITFFWQQVTMNIKADNTLRHAVADGYAELFAVSEDGNIGEKSPDSKIFFKQNYHLYDAPFDDQ